eukprot:CAMPEP_0176023242 /NCGR_PEP_ID=MMETSP0120_2-20121206/11333_1 /TAXON_ID=160619 /ORGANISM="Kryptoperidinium foliaceum, Strain CCMP 1326" /LENGTH=314 /DNA_ID=CAMNT_0017356399 /DNA_START=24 /DNA_END=965 /DNA_ORIENTATION=-
MRSAVCCFLLATAAAVQPKELSDWFASPDGLAMTRQDAAALAAQEAQTLTQCGVTIRALSDLKATMYDPGHMDLPMKELRSQILLLAEQHASPADLGYLFDVLFSTYTHGGAGLGLPKLIAQQQAIELARLRTNPKDLQSLYGALLTPSFGINVKRAQDLALTLARAGADSKILIAAYPRTRNLDSAVASAVSSNLDGVVRRHAKDGKPYTALEFQSHYRDWLSEWTDAPSEMHVAEDHKAYTAGEFATHYGNIWESKFKSGAVATQMRLAADGKPYDMVEFQSFYTDSWQTRWAAAPELPCKECAPFDASEVG